MHVFQVGNIYPVHVKHLEPRLTSWETEDVLLAVILFYALRCVFRFCNAKHPMLTALLVHYTVAYQLSGSIFAANICFMLIGFACVTRSQRVQRVMQRKITSSPITRW